MAVSQPAIQAAAFALEGGTAMIEDVTSTPECRAATGSAAFFLLSGSLIMESRLGAQLRQPMG
jgi:hypothetical protein